MDPKIRILQTTETPRFDEAGRAVPMIRVTWKYGADHGPYYEYLPKEGFSLLQFEQQIAPQVREFQQLPPTPVR